MKLGLFKNIIIKIIRLKAECSTWMSIKEVCERTCPSPYAYACPSVLNYVVRAVYLDCDISAAVFFKPATNEQRSRPLWKTMNTTGNDLGSVCCIFLRLRCPEFKIWDESYEKVSVFVTLWHAEIDVIPNTKYPLHC